MPYQVQHMIEGKSAPVCVQKEDSVAQALSIMIENDYSQLPVIHEELNCQVPDGLITYEGIIRGIRNFKAKIEDLRVRDVMVTAPVYSVEDDLFDILDRLKDTNAVLIHTQYDGSLKAIVTSYDATEYFRQRTEDLMRVEDVEVMIKDFIIGAYSQADGELNDKQLQDDINHICPKENDSKKTKTFSDLTLNEYISILLMKENWPFVEPFFGISKEFVRELLHGIRDIRNALAHFRGDLTAEERDKLKFGTEWLSKCQEAYHQHKQQQFVARAMAAFQQPVEIFKPAEVQKRQRVDHSNETGFTVVTKSDSGGRYDPLADHLQSQPGQIDLVELTFNQIEEIIGTDLPLSARKHKAWWANDSIGHSHSQLWLDAGWRSTYVNLSEGRVTFTRIKGREKAYIDFFTKLLDDLRKKVSFPIRDVSAGGTSWMIIQRTPRSGPQFGIFVFSFNRNKQLRVELYLDLEDQAQTKAAFDRLYAQRELIETQIGQPVQWERLDSRRASRIAVYHDGQITDEKNHPELRSWAVDTMIKFYPALAEPAERAICAVAAQ